MELELQKGHFVSPHDEEFDQTCRFLFHMKNRHQIPFHRHVERIEDDSGKIEKNIRCYDDDCDRFLNDPILQFFNENRQDEFFSLGLVVNWQKPSLPQVNAAAAATTTTQEANHNYNATNYQKFISAVKAECFQGKEDMLVCLPFHALHITVASCFQATRISEITSRTTRPKATGAIGESTNQNLANGSDKNTDIDKNNSQRRLDIANFWKSVLLQASASPDWPKRPLELELDSARIGNRAGILLWKERTGGLFQMRSCLEDAAAAVSNPEESLSFRFSQHLKIPNIVHTTFVRYRNVEDCASKSQSIDENALSWRPSQANDILKQRVMPFQPLFSKQKMDSNLHDSKTSYAKSLSAEKETIKLIETSLSKTVVTPDVVTLVDCKIYLLCPGKEKDHTVFLSLPLGEST